VCKSVHFFCWKGPWILERDLFLTRITYYKDMAWGSCCEGASGLFVVRRRFGGERASGEVRQMDEFPALLSSQKSSLFGGPVLVTKTTAALSDYRTRIGGRRVAALDGWKHARHTRDQARIQEPDIHTSNRVSATSPHSANFCKLVVQTEGGHSHK
jgi:hypothetical protein